MPSQSGDMLESCLRCRAKDFVHIADHMFEETTPVTAVSEDLARSVEAFFSTLANLDSEVRALRASLRERDAEIARLRARAEARR